jgi:hypothetical protein
VAQTKGKRVNARVHLRKILALAELHGKEAVARALDDGLELQAFSAEYIANILATRRRVGPEPTALQLTPRADLLDLELPECIERCARQRQHQTRVVPIHQTAGPLH